MLAYRVGTRDLMAIAKATVDFPAPGGPAIMLTSPRRMEMWASVHDLNGMGIAIVCLSMDRTARSSALIGYTGNAFHSGVPRFTQIASH